MTHDLIVFGEDWGGLPSSTQCLVGQLAKTRKIVWINSIGLRRPTPGWRDIKRAWHKLTANKHSTESDSGKIPNDNFHIVYPRTLPAPRSWLGRQLATLLLKKQILPVMKKADLKKPVLWTSLPTAVDLSGHLNESALVYYCCDDFSALAGVDHNTVAKRERELVQKADLILATSDELAQRFPAKTTRLLHHGVDYSLFAEPAPRAHDLPDNGAKKNRPIAGFYGSIDDRLDYDLLVSTIAQLPHWDFVFIGKPAMDHCPLSQFNNVTLLGERSHQQLPAYSQHWDVSLLPFIDNAMVRACNPMKLREYLAAGRPIVSTPIPAITPYRHLVHTVTDSTTMVAALEQSVQTPVDAKKQRDAVTEHTWTARATQLSDWLETL